MAVRNAFEENHRDVWQFAYRMLGNREAAEDVAQETFVRMMSNGKTHLDGAQARRWLFTVARNLCVDKLRRDLRQAASRNTAGWQGPALTPAEAQSATERRELVARAVAGLPVHLREAIVLRTYEQMSYAEMGVVLGCPVGTVRSRLARAREQLEKRLKPLMENEDGLETSRN